MTNLSFYVALKTLTFAYGRDCTAISSLASKATAAGPRRTSSPPLNESACPCRAIEAEPTNSYRVLCVLRTTKGDLQLGFGRRCYIHILIPTASPTASPTRARRRVRECNLKPVTSNNGGKSIICAHRTAGAGRCATPGLDNALHRYGALVF